MKLNLRLIDLAETSGFEAASGPAGGGGPAQLGAHKTLNIFSGGGYRARELGRTDLVTGSSTLSDCIFFGRYEGNGLAGMREGEPFRIYDGGQFICSRDGYFTRDMMFAGSCLPSFVNKSESDSLYHLELADDYAIADDADYVFMGAYHSHFGHGLVESLTRLWYVLQLSEVDRAKKKFVFFQGWGITGGPVPEILQMLGVPQQNIWVCTENTIFKRLTIPSFAWRPWNDWDIFLAKDYFGPLKKISDIVTKNTSRIEPADKIYLSRNMLKGHFNNRELNPAKNEALETDLRKRGFRMIAPETLSLMEQIALAANASHIVGPGGSAHHLAGFAYRAEHQVIVTHEGFCMGGNDSVFAWDKDLQLSYVFGFQAADSSLPPLTAPWDFHLSDWEKAAEFCGI